MSGEGGRGEGEGGGGRRGGVASAPHVYMCVYVRAISLLDAE